MKPYRYHSDAHEELLDATAFYESQQPGLARKFLRAVVTAIESMQFDPTARPIIEGEVRRQPVRRFSYDLLYADEPDCLRILAVKHHSRDDSYWRERL